LGVNSINSRQSPGFEGKRRKKGKEGTKGVIRLATRDERGRRVRSLLFIAKKRLSPSLREGKKIFFLLESESSLLKLPGIEKGEGGEEESTLLFPSKH